MVVCPGTYQQPATVHKALTLLGRPGSVIDASGLTAGIDVAADGVTVRGLTVVNASQYGILVTGGQATIVANTADSNGAVAGAETGGIFLRGAAGSRVERNTAKNNRGGITLDACPQCQVAYNTVTGSNPIGIAVGFDSTGALVQGNTISGSQDTGMFVFATSDVRVSGNRVTQSVFAGIFLPDGPGTTIHNEVIGNLVEDNGYTGIRLNTGSDGGVNDNIIQGNTVRDNAGAGIGLDDSSSGSSVQGNLIEGNRITGNGGPGVDVSDGYATDMNGNVVTGNRIGTNNLAPNPDQVPVEQTTGMYVNSVTSLSIQLSSNVIYSNYYGIWKNTKIDASGLASNHFANVTVPVFTAP